MIKEPSLKSIKTIGLIGFLAIVTLLSLSASLRQAQAESAAPLTPASLEAASAKVETAVLKQLQSDPTTDFFIELTEQADLAPASQLASKAEKGQFVYNALRTVAERSQRGLLTYLDSQQANYQSFYISNKVLVRGGSEALLISVAARPEVARITANRSYQLQPPTVNPKEDRSPTAVEPNITFVRANEVWDMGIRGEGTVLAGNDTGLAWDHPALINQYRGWDGTTADHNYNWWDATGTYPTVPGDGNAHGTHTSGTMVGDDGGENQIGVAPGSRLIHCKNLDDGGSGSDASILECFQWDLAPWDLNRENPRPDLAPDAINNSWGYSGGGLTLFQPEIAALQAAGILVEVSAGNSGPDCGTLGSPGDYGEVLTTGSIDHSSGALPGTISFFSSRGPSSLSGDFIPDIMAPGENIRSSVPNGGYEGGWSGTSMSGPHTTGLVGLMWSANPGLRGFVEETNLLIQQTAVPLSGQTGSNCGGDYDTGPNNDWGTGTIDALAAVQAAVLYGDPGTLTGTVRNATTTDPIANAQVTAALTPDFAWQRTTNDQGIYSAIVFSGTYTVTAQSYGFFPNTVPDIQVTSFLTTTLDLDLEPAPFYTVSGTVVDANTGWPLYAGIQIDGYPGDTVWTDPTTGVYTITLAAGVPYTFNVNAWTAGYLPANTVVGPLAGDQTQDFALVADVSICVAPGYQPQYIYFEDFEASDGGYTIEGTTSWAWGMPTSGPGAAHSGDNLWATNLAGNYGDNEFGYTSSPNIDLSSYAGQNLVVSWWQWVQTEECCDYVTVDVSNDGGLNWYNYYFFSGSSDWQRPTLFLDPSFATDQFRVRFGLSSDGSVTAAGFYVDDVGIGAASTAPTLYSTDFEDNDGDFAISGDNSSWAWGTPTRGPGAAHSGNNAWATALDGNYNNDENSQITSPEIDLSGGAGQPMLLTWWQWLQTEAVYDVARVDVSNDDGATWQTMFEVSGPIDWYWGEYGIYLDESYAVPDFRVRFTLQSDSTVTYPGIYIDDIRIIVYDPAPPTIPCVAQEGGLVIGQVVDANTDASLSGAKVSNPYGDVAFSGPTPSDPAIDEGFYTLFTPPGEQTLTAVKPQYTSDSQTISMTVGSVVTQNFSLGAGWLTAVPASLSGTVALGQSTTVSLTLENSGALAASFALREGKGGYTPAAGAPVVVPGNSLSAASTANSYGGSQLKQHESWSFRAPANAYYTGDTATVLLVSAGSASQIQALLQSFPDLTAVDFYEASAGTPTLDELNSYSTVVVISNFPFANPVALGDVLADYVDGGGSVVQTVPTFFDPGGAGWGLQGRFIDEGYSPFIGTGDWFSPANLAEFDASHPIMQGVTSASDFFRQIVELSPDAEWVASWTDDEFVATKGKVVALNTAVFDGYAWSGDIPLIVHNSIIWLQTAGDLPWLSTDPVTGTVESLATQPISVLLDASVAEVTQPGDYTAVLQVSNDTPYVALTVPVTMTVTPPDTWGRIGGTVQGLSACDTDSTPLANAQVAIADVTAVSTDADGSYAYWLEAGTYQIAISAPGYVAQTTTATVTAGGSVTVDVSLRADLPCYPDVVEPITANLAPGQSASSPLTLHNTGAGTLHFQMLETTLNAATAQPALRRATGPSKLFSIATAVGPHSIRSQASADPASPGREPASNWFGAADVPGGLVRYGHAQCDEQPSSFYLISGVDGSYQISSKTWRYDAADNNWVQLADIPVGQEGVTAVCYQGRIYVMGGSGTNQFYIYNIATDEWLEGAPLPRNVWGAAAAAWQGKVYLLGGDSDFYPGETSSEVNIYDIASNSWEGTGTPLPEPILAMGYVQQGPALYLTGGWNDNSPTSNVASTYAYHLGTDLWESGPALPEARADLVLAATRQSLYAIGGDADGNFFFDATTAVTQLSLTDWATGAWADTGDPLPAATTANGGGFCSSGFFSAQVWSVGGMLNGGIAGVNRFLGRPGESCYSIYEDVAWLSASPAAGSVAADSETAVDIILDATGLTTGTYTATLVIISNDQQQPLKRIPVTLIVTSAYP